MKAGKEEALRHWGVKIRASMDEAIASLYEENCLEESLRLFAVEGTYYVVGVMCAGKGGMLNPENPDRAINGEHHRVLRDCLEEELAQEKIYHVRADDTL